jgi:cytochrome c oxidase subunit 2
MIGVTPIRAEDAMRKLLVACACVALAAGVGAVAGPTQSPGESTQVKEVQMTAKKYEYAPSIVEVAAGTKIVFKITALDREHGFEIAGSNTGCVKIKKGETVTVEYLADKAGTVEFKCCVFCGLGHGRMKGKIVVH